MAQTKTKARGRKTASRGSASSRGTGKRPASKPQSNSRSNGRSTNSSSRAQARPWVGSGRQERQPNRQQTGSNRPQGSMEPRSSARSDGQQYLHRFFGDQLKDIYYAEQKLVQALATMRDAATTEELRDAFEDHLHLTERHVRRLERIFESLEMRPEGKRCEAIEGIIREVESIIGETEEGSITRDAALILGAQKAEHYEIATYGGLVTFAITMGLYEEAELLDKTLVEEEVTDILLTDIAEEYINIEAELESQGGEEEEEEDWETGEEGEEEEAEMGEESQSMGPGLAGENDEE